MSRESSHCSAGFDRTLNVYVPVISTGIVFLSIIVIMSVLDIFDPATISTGEPRIDSSTSSMCSDCTIDTKVTPDSCKDSM